VAIMKFKYGTGKDYPDLGAIPTESFVLETLIQLDYPPGNLGVANNSDVYFNYHPVAKSRTFLACNPFSNGRETPISTILIYAACPLCRTTAAF
jgi:hypothetical protein